MGDRSMSIFYALKVVESKMEFIVTESEEGDIIMITKHEFIYTDEACSSAISFEVSSNYSLVQKSTSGKEYIFWLSFIVVIILIWQLWLRSLRSMIEPT